MAAIDVGAFAWGRVQRLYDADPEVHWQRCEAEGLQCPLEVFTQLFHADATDTDFVAIVRAVDWGRAHWELSELSGIALRSMSVDRGYQHALDEARNRATQFGIVDDREEVVNHWRDMHSWFTPPVMVAGEVLASRVGYELLAGFTRLGNLLGLLDRVDVPEAQRHLAWIGHSSKKLD
jgi:hypothetical protein